MVQNRHERSSLDSFISALEACRPSFSAISFPEHLQRGRDHTHLRGKIAEKYVELWLQSCLGFSFCHKPHGIRGYNLQKRQKGLFVSQHGNNIIEYDIAGTYHDIAILAEVKADHARGYMSRVPFALEIGQALYAPLPAALLLFVPYQINSQRYASPCVVEQQNPMFRRVSMNYLPHELRQAVSSFTTGFARKLSHSRNSIKICES